MLGTSQKHPKLHVRDQKATRRYSWGVFAAVQLLPKFVTKLHHTLLVYYTNLLRVSHVS